MQGDWTVIRDVVPQTLRHMRNSEFPVTPIQLLRRTMTEEQHKERHEKLHTYLDELVADWIKSTRGLPSKTILMDFMKWSCEQTQKLDHEQ